MKKEYPYLRDSDFLYDICTQTFTNHYVKITILNWNEDPIQEFQGQATGGSLSINGSSSCRKTGSLTFLLNNDQTNVTSIDNVIAINKKVFVEIGLKNNLFNSKYEDDIIWFPQGVFLISTCSLNHSLSGITASIQIKDKMALLDGTCGGTIPAATEFHKYENSDERPTIYQIIQELVNHFGGEQLSKIIIKDLDQTVNRIVRWTGEDTTVDAVIQQGSVIQDMKIKNNEDIGYIKTNFYYTEDLIANGGDSVTSVLDKIKNYLGNYEYFYDVYGNFIFQEIKNYLNTSHATTDLNNLETENYLIDIANNDAMYNFSNNSFVTSYSRTPNFQQIKNDFVVWGTRTSASGEKSSIAYHLAIDTKPTPGNIYRVIITTDKYHNSLVRIPVLVFNIDAMTNQDLYYELVTITQADGNEIIKKAIYKYNSESDSFQEDANLNAFFIQTKDWRTELLLQGTSALNDGTDSGYYFAELDANWLQLCNLKGVDIGTYMWNINQNKTIKEKLYQDSFYSDLKWEEAIYFLDFIDSGSSISNFTIDNIGRRSKIENNDTYNCIIEPGAPGFYILNEKDEDNLKYCKEQNIGYIILKDNDYNNYISTGGYHRGCFSEIQNLLYQYTQYNESVSISGLPLYYLEPNIRVYFQDSYINIYGDYIINSITLPLTANGTMNISATKVLNKI